MSGIIGRLKKWRDMPLGEPSVTNNYAQEISAMCADAIAEIETLRLIAGVVSSGPALRDIKGKPDNG